MASDGEARRRTLPTSRGASAGPVTRRIGRPASRWCIALLCLSPGCALHIYDGPKLPREQLAELRLSRFSEEVTHSLGRFSDPEETSCDSLKGSLMCRLKPASEGRVFYRDPIAKYVGTRTVLLRPGTNELYFGAVVRHTYYTQDSVTAGAAALPLFCCMGLALGGSGGSGPDFTTTETVEFQASAPLRFEVEQGHRYKVSAHVSSLAEPPTISIRDLTLQRLWLAQDPGTPPPDPDQALQVLRPQGSWKSW